MTTYSHDNPTTYSHDNPFAPTEADEAPAGRTGDTDEVVAGPPVSPDNLLYRVGRLAFDLQAKYRDADSLDDAVEAMKAIKAAQDMIYEAYTLARNDMWENYGEGKHATESGRTFSFTAPSGSRSCNYADLEAKYPEAYAACVTAKGPKPDAVGSLRLPKGDVK